MKTFVLWTLLIAGLIPLTACHWNHRHHHRFAGGYDANDHALNHSDNIAGGESSLAA